MEITNIGINAKSELKNIKSLLRVGEIIEVSVVSEKGENIYLLRLKGNLFEGLTTKALKQDILNAKVLKTQPEIVMESQDDKTLTIKLTSFVGKPVHSSRKIKTDNVKNIVVKTIDNKNRAKIIFQKGDILQAEIVSKKSPDTYILKIDKALFEALTESDIRENTNKLTLVVEKVKPDIVLRVVNRNSEMIEYIKSPEKTIIQNTETVTDILVETINNIEKASESNDKKALVINTQKALNVLKSMEETSDRLKSTMEHIKSALKTSDAKQYINNVFKEENIKGNAPFNAVLEFAKEFEAEIATKNMNINISALGKDIDKLSSVFNGFAQALNGYAKQNGMSNQGFLIGFLNGLSEELDKIFKNSFEIEARIQNIQEAALSGKLQDIKEYVIKAKELLSSTMPQNKALENKTDSQKVFEGIKNAIQQAKLPPSLGNLFLQIPLVIGNKEWRIYVNKEKEQENNSESNNKKSFRIKLISDTGKNGVFQIDGIYSDGEITCTVGFEKESQLKLFNKNIEQLKESLGNKVTLSTFLLKPKPVIIPKKLNIKA